MSRSRPWKCLILTGGTLYTMRGGPLIFISNFSSLAQEHSTMPLVEEKRMLEMHFVYGKSIYLVLYPDLQLRYIDLLSKRTCRILSVKQAEIVKRLQFSELTSVETLEFKKAPWSISFCVQNKSNFKAMCHCGNNA